MQQEVKNQHYIPRSYLKNFGFLVNAKARPSGKVDKKWSIYNIEKGSDIKINDTKKICKEKYLYDLPFADLENKQFIEKAYDKQVDEYFGEVTRFLTNPRNRQLSSEMRDKVLKCYLSLVFRTPKYLSIEKEKILLKNLSVSEQEEQLKVIKSEKLEAHLKNFERLFHQKRNCALSVNYVNCSKEFISGDNPVIFRHPSGEPSDIFDPENIFHIPINAKFCLTILPESETKLLPTFVRYDYPSHQVITINYDIEQAHEEFIFGSKKALEDYIAESPFYKQPADENHPIFIEMERTVEALDNCLDIANKFGLNSVQYKYAFEYYWREIQMFREDPNNIKMKAFLKTIHRK